jgi:hypothetical protein
MGSFSSKPSESEPAVVNQNAARANATAATAK